MFHQRTKVAGASAIGMVAATAPKPTTPKTATTATGRLLAARPHVGAHVNLKLKKEKRVRICCSRRDRRKQGETDEKAVPTFRFPFVVKAFPHTVHLNGLSPVCVLMWIWSADPELKFFLHTWQRCFRLTGVPLELLEDGGFEEEVEAPLMMASKGCPGGNEPGEAEGLTNGRKGRLVLLV